MPSAGTMIPQVKFVVGAEASSYGALAGVRVMLACSTLLLTPKSAAPPVREAVQSY